MDTSWKDKDDCSSQGQGQDPSQEEVESGTHHMCLGDFCNLFTLNIIQSHFLVNCVSLCDNLITLLSEFALYL